jgi:hypothetical protein
MTFIHAEESLGGTTSIVDSKLSDIEHLSYKQKICNVVEPSGSPGDYQAK